MPKPDAIREYWWQKLTEIGKFDGRFEVFGGTYCFACGVEAQLERAHITPHHAGGGEDADNLHLLCGNCHYESEPLWGDDYWKWFVRKSIGDSRMTRAASLRLVRGEIPMPRSLAEQPKPRSLSFLRFPASICLAPQTARLSLDMTQPADDGIALIPNGANTIIFKSRSVLFGTCTKQIGHDGRLSMYWQTSGDSRIWKAMGNSCTASVTCESIEERRPSKKDRALWGNRVNVVCSKWKLINLDLIPN